MGRIENCFLSGEYINNLHILSTLFFFPLSFWIELGKNPCCVCFFLFTAIWGTIKVILPYFFLSVTHAYIGWANPTFVRQTKPQIGPFLLSLRGLGYTRGPHFQFSETQSAIDLFLEAFDRWLRGNMSPSSLMLTLDI